MYIVYILSVFVYYKYTTNIIICDRIFTSFNKTFSLPTWKYIEIYSYQ